MKPTLDRIEVETKSDGRRIYRLDVGNLSAKMAKKFIKKIKKKIKAENNGR